MTEYVNIFGVPFTFLPHESGDGPPPEPPKPKTRIEPDKRKAAHKIEFPNVVRIDRAYRPQLSLDFNTVKPLTLDPMDTITVAELEAMLNGKPNPIALTEIDLKTIANNFRLQTLIFKIAASIYHSDKKHAWKGSVESFLIQLIGIVETFVRSSKLQIKNPVFDKDDLRRRVLIMLNMRDNVMLLWSSGLFCHT